MSDYTAPLRDIRFVLEHITPLDDLQTLPDFEHADLDMVMGLLQEAGRLCEQAVAPTNRDGDLQGSKIVDGGVQTPDGFKKVYDQWVEAGWGALPHAPEFGGGGFPLVVGNVVKEMLTSANMSFSLCPLLSTGAVTALAAHGGEELQATYLPKLVTGEWAGTMNLTEPQAGSDVGAITTRAVEADDGTYRITGQKIYITYGEHDLTEQIVHLVLARLPDAPPGTKGISLFVVPKYLVNDDGSLGERNDVHVVSLEHKLGIHASPTCVMAFGENSDGAVGELVGQPNSGMRAMFTMMNDARLGVGIEGLAIAERAYQQALDYARERKQGSAPGSEPGEQSTIIEHPDVRRMLMTMKAFIEAMRCLCYANAEAIDYAEHHTDEDAREEWKKRADLLTPISKAWCTDLGVELTSINIQVHGGMGYVEETGAAQHFRDARIAPIYEGTNGIQALDLVGRKLPYDNGAVVKGLIGEMRETAEGLDGELSEIGERLADAVGALDEATDWIFEHREDHRDVFAAATDYLEVFGLTIGGWFLARSAQAARSVLDAGGGDGDKPFLEDKIVTARFYAERLLPRARALAEAATAGADDLFAIAPDRLGA